MTLPTPEAIPFMPTAELLAMKVFQTASDGLWAYGMDYLFNHIDTELKTRINKAANQAKILATPKG